MKVRINEYELTSPKIKTPFKAICLSDIHSSIKYLSILDKMIAEAEADAIFIAGDTFDEGDHIDNKKTYEYLINLSNKYPVFFGLGNHDLFFKSTDKNYAKLLSSNSKCIMLDKMQSGYSFKNIKLYSFNMPLKWYETGEKSNTYLKEIQKIKFNKNNYNLVISHSPNGVLAPNGMLYNIPNVNLILSGHNHGCMTPLWFRKIFKVGILGPYHRHFVKSWFGYHTNNETHLIINDGVTKASYHTLRWHLADDIINNIFKINMDILYFKNGDDNIKLINTYMKR